MVRGIRFPVGAAACLAFASLAHALPLAFVTNEGSNSVSIVDLASTIVVATVAVGSSPYGAVAGPGGTRAYVANRTSDDVSVIDVARRTVVAAVPVGRHPYGIAVHPAGTRVYVANLADNAVSVIDTATDAVVAVIRVDGSPRGVVTAADGALLYVATAEPGLLVTVDTRTNRVVDTVPLDAEPYGLVASRDGRYVYIATRVVTALSPPPPCSQLPCPLPPSLVSGHVMTYDSVTNAVIDDVQVPGIPFALAVSADARKIYATLPGEGAIAVIDNTGDSVVVGRRIEAAPYGIVLQEDGRILHIADRGRNKLLYVDAATLEVVAESPVGAGPVAFGAFVGPPASLTAVEYLHVEFDHYFVTAGAFEIHLIDAGLVPGWLRTGATFRVARVHTNVAADVCRFWSGASYAPRSSHFYTSSVRECAIVKTQPEWIYEGDAFAMMPTDAGACGAGLTALYRLYNNAQEGAPNHRYTTSRALRAETIARGWTAEGQGIGVIGCVPAQ